VEGESEVSERAADKSPGIYSLILLRFGSDYQIHTKEKTKQST
jgi:hypothetical protein